MGGIRQICGKELARVFRDVKMVFSVFFMPVIIMIAVMSLVSNMSMKAEQDVEEHVPVVYVENAPEGFDGFLKQAETACTLCPVEDREAVRESIRNGDADLWIEFPENFQEAVSDYQTGDEIVQVKTYYNPSEEYSRAAYNTISAGVLEMYRQKLLAERVDDMQKLTVFTVNSDNPDMVIQDEQKAGGKVLGTMLPYFVTILLFAGAMGIGTDMVAGEKERGTMASLLVSPIKRRLHCARKGVCPDDHLRRVVGRLCCGHGHLHAPDAGRLFRGGFRHQPDARCRADRHAGGASGCHRVFVLRGDRAGFRICKNSERGKHLCDAHVYADPGAGDYDHVYDQYPERLVLYDSDL